jgi:hypothetical protein
VADRELIEKLTEIMKPLDNEIMMCDTNNDLLLLASCMMAVSMQIYKTQLGSKKVKIILQSAIDRIR